MGWMKAALVAAALAAVLGLPAQGFAQDAGVKLFKVVTAKDEAVIGFTSEELKAFGMTEEIDRVATALTRGGHMTVWQYGPKRAASGQTQQAPLRRIVVFASALVRIEPFTTDQEVVAPPK